ncbi:O-acetyl-ADP-ribose deacetylase MACROD2 [Channa argus]|uniref:O-acetyl-ADP-ribose deacetylase MACROD2 n=1 Tax=Channa argus TaxID=215402 RepID=A0A6G1R1X9_CHAAH|nr:O-acetyl-ADP-ribose deacetylase MACROD2 [Channa argus]
MSGAYVLIEMTDVIHTVGPVARGHVGPTEKNDLTSCYQNSLRLLTENGSSTVAFPCISTGIYGFPNEPAAEIALNTVKSWIEENPDKNITAANNELISSYYYTMHVKLCQSGT